MKKSEVRITKEALRFYVPLFHLGEEAEHKLLDEGSSMTPALRHHYENVAKFKPLAVDKIAALSGPLITQELNKIISTSHLKNRREDLFTILYYAGIDGMKKGLRKFDVDKINSSSTNYLFQWIVTYAKKELVVLEAPFGIRPSRFQRYKKISAVRKKLSEQLKRDASNQEIYEYFQSGAADIKNLNGKVKDHDKPSQANLSITLELIEEQETFEKEMMNVDFIDPLEDYGNDIQMQQEEKTIFEETIFGSFCKFYKINKKAQAVIMSDLAISDNSVENELILKKMSNKDYKNLSNQWKNLIQDVNGPFYDFLQKNKDNDFTEFDVRGTIKSIEANNIEINKEMYQDIFVKE